MTTDRRPSTPPGVDDGFTLIELLVAMVLSLIVLLATLQTFDAFNSSAAQQTRQTNANDRARATMDRVVDDLRGAAVIRTAAATDLVYSVALTSGTRTERLCVANGVLWESSSTSSTVPGTACGTAGTGWTQSNVATVPATTTTGFTYDGATSSVTPATVRSVGLTFNIDASGGGKTASSTLIGSASLRRTTGQIPLTDSDITVTCTASGPLLSLSAAAAGSVSALGLLGVNYAASGGISLNAVGSSPVQLPKTVTRVVAKVTDSLGVTTTLVKDVQCD